MMKKGYLVFAQDMRGHFATGKVFMDLEKAQEYEKYLNTEGYGRCMGPELRFVDDVDLVEIEIED